MSCTVFAVPYAIAWVVGALATGILHAAEINNELKDEILDFDNNISNNPEHICEDIQVINQNHILEKSFETIFMDKNILMKTLEEHGVQNISENEYGQISGNIDSYVLNFERMENDKPYFVKISCLESDNAKEKFEDLTSEYTLNVQEESYLSIVNKLKENNMEIEDEEVMDDNTIVLTVNLD